MHTQDSKIDLNPMLDVVFIMLIFFVVTATFVIEQGIDVGERQDTTHQIPDKPPTSILVSITSQDRFLINGDDVDLRLLRPQFERLSALDPKAPVLINPHAESSTASVIQVMDSASLAGIENVKFAYQQSH